MMLQILPQAKQTALSHSRPVLGRWLFLFLCIFGSFLFTQELQAATFTTVSNGEWSDPGTWSGGAVPPVPIPVGDVVNVGHSLNTFSTSAITNNGTINISGTGMIQVLGTTVLTNNGGLNGTTAAYANLWVQGTSHVVNNGTMTIDGNSALRLDGGDFTNGSSATLDLVDALFTIENENSKFTNEAGGVVNIDADTQFNILFFTSTNIVFSNAGEVNVDGILSFFVFSTYYPGEMENLATGVINVNGSTFGYFSLGTALYNYGTINLSNTTSRIDLTGTIDSSTGTLNHTNGLIRGNGSLILPNYSSDGTLVPAVFSGATDVTIDLTGNYAGTGTYQTSSSGNGPNETGLLAITGTADLSQLTLSYSYFLFSPAIGDEFTILTAGGGVSGPFAATSLQALPSDLEWEVIYNANSVVLKVVASVMDMDMDGVPDDVDNCPTTYNPLQENNDMDAEGDVCDPDDDNDGITDVDEQACGSDPFDENSLCPPAESLSFDGVNDLVYVFPFGPAPGSFTIEAWFMDDGGSGYENIVGWLGYRNGQYQQILVGTQPDGTLRYGNFDYFNGSYIALNGTTNVRDGQWHHVAAVTDGDQLYLYVDGQLEASDVAPANNTVEFYVTQLRLGNQFGSGEAFTGKMDEVRIWSVARSQSELERTMDCELGSEEEDLLAYYQFNVGIAAGNNSGEYILPDMSGNGKNGLLYYFDLMGSSSNWVLPGAVSTGVTCASPVDDEKPTISCGGLDMEATAPEGTCEVTLDLNVPQATDNVGVTSLTWRYRELVDGAPGSWSSWMTDPYQQTFAVGEYEIQWRARDAAGNARRCKYDLVILDEEDPVINCADLTVVFNGETTIIVKPEDIATAGDNCGLASLDIDLASVSCEQIDEVIELTALATDLSGNTAECTAMLTVDGLPCGWRTEGEMIDCEGEDDYTAATETFYLSSEDCHNPATDTDDEFAFIQTTLCGNSSITAQVTSLQATDQGWAGVNMRNSNDPGAVSVALLTNLSTNHRTELRLAQNGDVTSSLSPSFNRHWLRLERVGNNIRGFVSFNGLSWYSKFNLYVPMDQCIEVGLVVNGYTSDSDVAATFDNVSVTGGTQTPALQTLPTETPSRAFSAYPNPTAGVVTLNMAEFLDQEAILHIRDEYGRTVEQRDLGVIDNAQVQLDLSRYAAGVYTIHLQLPGGEMHQQRVVLLPRP